MSLARDILTMSKSDQLQAIHVLAKKCASRKEKQMTMTIAQAEKRADNQSDRALAAMPVNLPPESTDISCRRKENSMKTIQSAMPTSASFPMTPERTANLDRRLRYEITKDPELAHLNRLLIKLGGEYALPAPRSDRMAPQLLEEGFLMQGPTTLKSDENFFPLSHQNAALMWLEEERDMVGIGTGYVLCGDGFWRRESWGLLRDGVIETIKPRLKHFGIVLQGEYAENFANVWMDLDDPDEMPTYDHMPKPTISTPHTGRTFEEIMDARDQLKKEYGSLFDTVSSLLCRYDPIELAFSSENSEDYTPDQYDPQAEFLLLKLRTCKGPGDVLHIVHKDIVTWFDPEYAGPAEWYYAIAAEIWELWQAVGISNIDLPKNLRSQERPNAEERKAHRKKCLMYAEFVGSEDLKAFVMGGTNAMDPRDLTNANWDSALGTLAVAKNPKALKALVNARCHVIDGM